MKKEINEKDLREILEIKDHEGIVFSFTKVVETNPSVITLVGARIEPYDQDQETWYRNIHGDRLVIAGQVGNESWHKREVHCQVAFRRMKDIVTMRYATEGRWGITPKDGLEAANSLAVMVEEVTDGRLTVRREPGGFNWNKIRLIGKK